MLPYVLMGLAGEVLARSSIETVTFVMRELDHLPAFSRDRQTLHGLHLRNSHICIGYGDCTTYHGEAPHYMIQVDTASGLREGY